MHVSCLKRCLVLPCLGILTMKFKERIILNVFRFLLHKIHCTMLLVCIPLAVIVCSFKILIYVEWINK